MRAEFYRILWECLGRLVSPRQTIADYENINLVSIYCKRSLFITS